MNKRAVTLFLAVVLAALTLFSAVYAEDDTP